MNCLLITGYTTLSFTLLAAGGGDGVARLYAFYEGDCALTTGHVLCDWVQMKAPTCTEDGEEMRKCMQCDFSETRVIETSGHQWGSWVSEGSTGHIHMCTRKDCNIGERAAHTLEIQSDGETVFWGCTDCTFKSVDVHTTEQTLSVKLHKDIQADMVYAALYDPDGRFVQVAIGQVIDRTVSLTFTGSTAGRSIKLFFLSNTLVPGYSAMDFDKAVGNE